MLVKNTGHFVHFAIERESLDGPYVECITHSLELALRLIREDRVEAEAENEEFAAASEDAQYSWVWGSRLRVHAFDAAEDVALGWMFGGAALRVEDVKFHPIVGVTAEERRNQFVELIG